MEEEIALKIIEEIKNNPGIHYIELRDKTKDYVQEEALYRVLYAFTSLTCKEMGIENGSRVIKSKETNRYDCRNSRSIERSTFEFVFDKEDLMEQFKKQFSFWKLRQ
ncbi:hypothetical protein HZA33_00535 [Candidatus Pacearchaeota archaeon]|nr:hypothetical protein [Candidatus Pacearchaeota archaeon]